MDAWPGQGERLEAVIPVHTHFDHAMDSALVADRTGARLVGGESAANLCRGHGLPEDEGGRRGPRRTNRLGAFDVTLDRVAPLPTGPVPWRDRSARCMTAGEASAYRF